MLESKYSNYDHLGGNNKTRTGIVNELIQMGLIEESRRGRHNVKIITLTDKGKEVLDGMRKIMAIMNGEIVPNEGNHGTPSAHDATEAKP